MALMRYSRIFLLVLLLTPQSLVNAQTTSLKRLRVNKPVVTSFVSPAPHRYRVPLRSGQAVWIMLTKPTFSTVLRLIEPGSSGKKLELHFPAAPQVQEPIYWIATKAGSYQIEVAPAGQPAAGTDADRPRSDGR